MGTVSELTYKYMAYKPVTDHGIPTSNGTGHPVRSHHDRWKPSFAGVVGVKTGDERNPLKKGPLGLLAYLTNG